MMTKIYSKALSIALVLFSTITFAQNDLIITGVLDGDLTGGLPKAIELYILNDVSDLSTYGLGSANNGGGSDGEEFSFPAEAVSAGDYIYISTDAASFNTYFGFEPDFIDANAAGINGDDAIELFWNGDVIDVFGEIDTDGSGTDWEYADSWAYRNDGTSASTSFNIEDWSIPGAGTLNDETTNAGAANPWPLGTYLPDSDGPGEALTIAQIQTTTAPTGDSPLVGQSVITSGIVTAKYENGFWIQDGTGPWSGIFVRQDNPTVAQGDEVIVHASVQENFGLTRLNSVTEITPNSFANPLPDVTTVSTLEAGTEPYESVLIQVLEVTCVNEDIGFGEWLVNDGSGSYRVDDELYNAGPILFQGYDITGIAYWSFDNWKLLPRDANDVLLNDAASELGISFEIDELNVSETDGTITVNVNISNPTDIATTVDVVVSGGSAINGLDFTFTDPFTITFPANSSATQPFTFDIIDDELENGDRTIVFELENANNDALFGTTELDVNIDDDDAIFTVTDIATVAEVDDAGVAVNLGSEFTIGGTVYGVNMNSNGLQFTLIDPTGGIGLFTEDMFEYSVSESDSVLITGVVSQFNGLTQINPSSITLISEDNDVQDPIVVTELNEFSESNLVKLECVFITNPENWTGSGSGFNVTVSNGTTEYTIRIDNDVDLYNMMAPTGAFDIVGIGGQYDTQSPYLEGYQLFPRSSADIIASDCDIEQPPVNDNCSDAISINDLLGGEIGVIQNSTIYTNVDATVSSDEPTYGYECFGEPDGSADAPSVEHTVWFEFTGDGSTYLIETNNCDGDASDYIPDGDTQLAIYSGICAIATAEACSEDGPSTTSTEFPAGLAFATQPGQSYLLMVDGYLGGMGEFCLSFTRMPVFNDDCEGALNLSGLMGGALNIPQVSPVYSNIGATSNNDPDLNANDDCWFGNPTTAQTVWFSFTGDGNTYNMETANCSGTLSYASDTQMALFTGDCDNLVQISCNEDIGMGNTAAGLQLQTVQGVNYSILIDSYEALQGEFCVQMTQVDPDGMMEKNSFEFQAYPNPVSAQLIIEAPQVIDAASLKNVLGQLSRDFRFSAAQRVELNLTGLESGIYLLQVRSGSKIATSKIVVE